MISEQKVKHIAKLARLGLTKEEIKKFQKEFSLILDYIEKLKEIDISKIEPTSHSIKIENVTRSDEGEKPGLESRKLLELTPELKDSYLRVKSVF